MWIHKTSQIASSPVAMASNQLQIHGERFSGQDVRSQNTTAALAVSNVLKSSLGPVGLDKVRVNYRWSFLSMRSGGSFEHAFDMCNTLETCRCLLMISEMLPLQMMGPQY